jgi:ATP-dependent Clp protease ATP-binding subunit ClpA
MPSAQRETAASDHFALIVASACALASKAHEIVEPDHLFLAICYQNGPLWRAAMRDMQIDPIALRLHIESCVDRHNHAREVLTPGVLSNEVNAAIGRAHAYGEQRGCAPTINVGTVLIALVGDERIATMLQEYGVDAAGFRSHVERNMVAETNGL